MQHTFACTEKILFFMEELKILQRIWKIELLKPWSLYAHRENKAEGNKLSQAMETEF